MRIFEIEQKYRIKNPKTIRVLLKKLRAKKIASGHETSEFFDRQGFLRKKKIALRLRRHGKKSTLTVKGPRQASRFTKRMEIEAPVDYQAVKAILQLSGFEIIKKYKKIRELYRLGKSLITLDRLPKFGWFLEIEGVIHQIAKIEKQLELEKSDREKKSYLHMMFGWKH